MPIRRADRSGPASRRWITPLLTLLALCGLILLGTLLWREYKAHQEVPGAQHLRHAARDHAARRPVRDRKDQHRHLQENQTLRRPHHLAVGAAR